MIIRVIASEAKQSMLPHEERMDCFGLRSRNDGIRERSANALA